MSHIRVLIVEDNRVIASQLYDYLEAKNFVVEYANDGNSGLRLVEKNTYDVIILDLTLPDIDGVELCELLKRHGEKNVPVLMLTARDSLHDKGIGFAAGAIWLIWA